MGSINPEIWGPVFWNTINILAINYPEKPNIQDQNNITSFLTNLKNILPCEKCRNHYKENIEKFPISQALTSRSNFIKWVIDIHNSINKTHGKKVLTYDEGLYEMKKNVFGEEYTIYQPKYYFIFGMVLSIIILWSLRKTNILKSFK